MTPAQRALREAAAAETARIYGITTREQDRALASELKAATERATRLIAELDEWDVGPDSVARHRAIAISMTNPGGTARLRVVS